MEAKQAAVQTCQAALITRRAAEGCQMMLPFHHLERTLIGNHRIRLPVHPAVSSSQTLVGWRHPLASRLVG